MKGRILATLAATIAAVALWVVNCSGPAPVVTGVRVDEPVGQGTPYRIEATIHNRGVGHGQVSVSVRLRDRASGWIVEKEEQVTLDRGETAVIVAELQAPPGQYAPEVSAVYPPR
jgi:hypothetical protein